MFTFALAFERVINMVTIVQLVRASDCGSECRGFESSHPFKGEFSMLIPTW